MLAKEITLKSEEAERTQELEEGGHEVFTLRLQRDDRTWPAILMAQEDAHVLDGGDQVVLDLLAPEPSPARAFKVMIVGGVSKASFCAQRCWLPSMRCCRRLRLRRAAAL